MKERVVQWGEHLCHPISCRVEVGRLRKSSWCRLLESCKNWVALVISVSKPMLYSGQCFYWQFVRYLVDGGGLVLISYSDKGSGGRWVRCVVLVGGGM